MKNPVEVRRASLADAAEVAALDAVIFGAAGYSVASWRDEIANPSGQVFLCGNSGTHTAFLSILRAGDELEIRKIGVLPEMRRHGIAQDLLTKVLADEKNPRCIIDVSEHNAAAIAFYRKLGFQELMRRRKYYSDGADAIVMQRIK